MIIGHQKQWHILKNIAETRSYAHAYLFQGQNQLGKKTIALEFIKLLNCQDPNFSKRPCNVCRSCQDIQKSAFPDLTIIVPRSRQIQISQIRELTWNLSLRPYTAPFKAVIIDQAHCLNAEAQNALLKILEEPKGETLIILITEYPKMLFSTCVSRCEIMKFYPVPQIEIENYLLTKKLPQDKIKEIARFSFGRPGKAIDFLLNPQKLKIRERKIKEIISLTSPDSTLGFRFQYAKKLSQQGSAKPDLEIWLRYFREVLIETIKHPSQTKKYSLAKLKNILRLIQKIDFLLSTTNINQKLALEMLMVHL